MRILDSWHKLQTYFGDTTYVAYGNDLKFSNEFKGFPLPFYPIDYNSLLDANLFERFDKNGIPLKYLGEKYTYFYTKIFTYGLASLHRHLMGLNDRDYFGQFEKVVEYIKRTIHREKECAFFRNYEIESSSHDGRLCGAMEQGLGISLLCYAYCFSKDEKLLTLATDCLRPYQKEVGAGGVSRKLERYSVAHWYEEFPTRNIHVLNGKLDSLIGPYFLYKLNQSDKAKDVLIKGVNAVEGMLPYFDRGYWSSYFLADKGPSYIASMKYHSIHIFQLKALGEELNNEKFLLYAKKFEKYKKGKWNKYRALLTITIEKLCKIHRQ